MTTYRGDGKKKGRKSGPAHTIYGKGFNTIYGPKTKKVKAAKGY